MFLSDRSIDRPVLTSVVTVAILLAGWIGYRGLAVRELPDVEFPIVSVNTVLPGASPEVVETEVTEVLEEEINTIEGIEVLTSISGEQTSIITADFELQRDIDFALQDVRTRVSRIRGELPDDVEDPIVQKLDPDAQPIMWLAIQNPNADVVEINEIADDVVKERIQTLPGVGSVVLGGSQRFAVRVSLDPQRMAAFDITVGDVRRALETGNVEIPSGRIEGESREFTVRTEGELPSPEAFNDLIVAYREAAPIRLGDVGNAGPGIENERTLGRFNGEPTVGVGVVKQSGANTVEVAERVEEEVETLRAEIPAGFTIRFAFNSADFVEQSVAEVEETLFIAFGLVVVVILLFLGNWRATFIPILAIPVSIIGTFAAFALLGFSINTLTLLALVLAIGIVVDDAIVVVENIFRHMEEGEEPREAARKGTAEIAFAVIAISLTLVIVFLPIAFITGITGRLFREFGVGVAVAVVISAFVALTLTPMLSSRFLKPNGGSNPVFRAMDRGLDRITDGYERMLGWAVHRRGLMVLIAFGSFAAALFVMTRLPAEFEPQTDRGQFLVMVTAPEGATLEYTDRYMTRVERMLGSTEGVQGFFSAIGLGIGGPAKVSEGIAFVRLEQERERDQFEIIDEVRGKTSSLAGVDVLLISPSALGGGFEQPVQYVVQGDDLDELAAYGDSILARMRAIEGLEFADSDLDLNKPELAVTVDRNKAASLGVNVADVATTLQVLLGGRDLSEFERGSERYEVVVQMPDSLRSNPRDLSSIYVRGDEGGLVQLSNVVNVAEGVGPSQINHFDRRRSVTLSATNQDLALSDALEQIDAAAEELLPAGYRTTVAGQSQDFQESFASLVFALIMAVVAIYLVLAGQFESFLHPLTIMLALPLALIGAVAGIAMFGMTLNIYSMIGIIMLMGLVTKNSILLVDYANQRRELGMERERAIIEAGIVRLRPILMTSASIIIGLTPIALALGAGAGSRRPLGVAVIGGMITSTALTLLVVPVFYLMLESGLERILGWARAAGRRWLGGGPDVASGAARAGLLLVAGLSALALGAAPATAQESGRAAQEDRAGALELDLDAAVARAVTRNESVLIARADQARIRGVETEVRSRSLPEITADFDYTRNIQQPVLFFDMGDGVEQISVGSENEYTFGLTLRQSLLDLSLGPARRAAKLSRRATAATVEAARTSAALEARVAYFRVLLDDALFDVQEQALEQALDRLGEVESQHEAGTASDFDLLTAQVEVDNIRPRVIEARNRLALDRDRLKRTLNLELDAELVLTDSLRRPGTEEPAEAAAVARAFRERADLEAQRTRLDLQQANVDVEQGSAWPSFDLVATLSRRASSGDFLPGEEDFSQSATAGVSMSLPLFDGRARSGRVQQARAASERERHRLERLRADVELEVESALQTLEASREQVEASEANVERAERALEIAQTRFRNGLSTQVELNDSELAATRARSNHVQALYDYNVARATLRAATGRR